MMKKVQHIDMTPLMIYTLCRLWLAPDCPKVNTLCRKIILVGLLSLMPTTSIVSAQILNPYEPHNAVAAEPGDPYCLLQPPQMLAPIVFGSSASSGFAAPKSSVQMERQGPNFVRERLPRLPNRRLIVFPTPFKW